MTGSPAFPSDQEYSSRIGEVGFWWPYLARILGHHRIGAGDSDPVAGVGGTYPTFICGDVVVKLFGHLWAWRRSHTAERAALALIATDPEIRAPHLLADGQLEPGGEHPWPYLITTRMPGVPWRDAALSAAQRLGVAAELGWQIRRLHALRPAGVATLADWPAPSVAAAAARSSLPPHLVAQVEGYVARLGRSDPVFVHADLTGRHAFVRDGRLAGIIDWGDAIVGDRHVELIQIYRDTFDCDAALLRVFLEAADWPIRPDFAHQALGHALHRQAVGLAQHPTIDVFEPIAARFPLHRIATLEELATLLFAPPAS